MVSPTAGLSTLTKLSRSIGTSCVVGVLLCCKAIAQPAFAGRQAHNNGVIVFGNTGKGEKHFGQLGTSIQDFFI